MNNDPKEPRLLDHEADGIRELDNLLPRWWVWLFYITIVFSAVYLGYYHVFGKGDLQIAEYEKEWKRGEEIKAAAIAKFESSLSSLTVSTDEVVLAQGLGIYTTYCAPCHRPDGGGLWDRTCATTTGSTARTTWTPCASSSTASPRRAC
ncbi:MAG: hypothetical protein HC841_06190 [Verrucomicrobiae bacterium]|nr:hypothetical protein [Verrucomicrobiae bacterium]